VTPAAAEELTIELGDLVALAGPSGAEEPVANWIAGKLSEFDIAVTRDTLGNVLVAPGGRPRLLVTAHMDQVGYMVSRLDDDRAYCQPVGSPAVTAGRRVAVQILGDGHVPFDGELESIGEKVGIVRTDRLAELSVGDRVVYAPGLEVRGDRTVRGPSLDDRIGCLVALHVARTLDREEAGVAFAWTVREESEQAGVMRVARDLDPEALIALDITYATSEEHVSESPVVVGQGPAITLLDGGMVGHGGLVQALISAAGSLRMPWQPEVVRLGVSEAGRVQRNLGIPSLALLVPIENPHSPEETADMRDLVSVIELLIVAVGALAPSPHPRTTQLA
jgi:endoglucanase